MRHGPGIEGDVRAVGRGGDAVVQTGEGVVLVAGGLPGERVEVVPTTSSRGARRGRLKRILEESADRREPPCVHVGRCGGCPLMIASPDLQHDIKRGFLEDACRGLPGAADTSIEWIDSPHALGYRQRARLAWSDGAMGYRSHRSTRVADIDRCVVLKAELEKAWSEARRVLGPHLQGAGEVQLQLTVASKVAIALDAAGDQPASLFGACEALSAQPGIAGVALRVGRSGYPAVWGSDRLAIGTGRGESLDAPYGAFSQANDAINAALIDTVIELSAPQGQRVLELHCGVGNFTMGLAATAKSLVAVERDAEAAAACRDNLARRGLRGRVVVGDADDPPNGRYDLVVLDPPRQGSRAFFERSGVLPGPARVIYVSCDTATLARDLRIAAALGFQLDRAIALDMFPQTAHLESVVRLVRA